MGGRDYGDRTVRIRCDMCYDGEQELATRRQGMHDERARARGKRRRMMSVQDGRAQAGGRHGLEYERKSGVRRDDGEQSEGDGYRAASRTYGRGRTGATNER